jgi:hypothetical protein
MNLLTVYNDRLKGLHLEIINSTYNGQKVLNLTLNTQQLKADDF